jgi:hypothetical protein
MKLIMRNHFLKIVSKQNKLLCFIILDLITTKILCDKNICNRVSLGDEIVCCLRLIGSVVTYKVTSFE